MSVVSDNIAIITAQAATLDTLVIEPSIEGRKTVAEFATSSWAGVAA